MSTFPRNLISPFEKFRVSGAGISEDGASDSFRASIRRRFRGGRRPQTSVPDFHPRIFTVSRPSLVDDFRVVILLPSCEEKFRILGPISATTSDSNAAISLRPKLLCKILGQIFLRFFADIVTNSGVVSVSVLVWDFDRLSPAKFARKCRTY